MEENNNQNANTEEVKKETTDKAKGFVSNLFKNPIDQIEKIATSPKNQFLKVAIISSSTLKITVFILRVSFRDRAIEYFTSSKIFLLFKSSKIALLKLKVISSSNFS